MLNVASNYAKNFLFLTILLNNFAFSAESKVHNFDTAYINIINRSPMVKGSQLWGRAWRGRVGYDETVVGVDCDDVLAASKVSSCTVKLNPRYRNDIYPVADQVEYKSLIDFSEIKLIGVWVRIKAKAWAGKKGSYCQLTMKISQSESGFSEVDFVQHVEVFRHSNSPLDGRNINYSTLPIILSSGGDFWAKFSREIVGDCEVSVAITVLGGF